jgi:hypothetical protein
MANATTWMTDNFSHLSGKTLQEIVFFGTHDTGMSVCHGHASQYLPFHRFHQNPDAQRSRPGRTCRRPLP